MFRGFLKTVRFSLRTGTNPKPNLHVFNKKKIFCIAALGLLPLTFLVSSSAEQEDVDDNEVSPVNGTDEEIKSIDTVQKESNKRDYYSQKIDDYDYVIVGGGVAAESALNEMMKLGIDKQILLITQESSFPFDKVQKMTELWSKEEKSDDNPKPTYPSNVTIMHGTFQGFDIKDKVLGVTGESPIYVGYHKLLLATGSRPVLPSFPYPSSSNVIMADNYHDQSRLASILSDSPTSRVAVVGDNIWGTKLAEDIARAGSGSEKSVSLVLSGDGVLSKFLPPHVSRYLTDRLASRIDVQTRKVVKEVVSRDDKLVVSFDDDTDLHTDYVVFSLGSKPNTLFFHELEVEKQSGAFHTTSTFRAHDDVWVVGDAVAAFDPYTDELCHQMNLYNAEISGIVAANNMTKKKKKSVLPFWATIFDLTLGDIHMGFQGKIDSSLDTACVWLKGPVDFSQVKWVEGTGDDEGVLFPAIPPHQDPEYELNNVYEKGVIYYLGKDRGILGLLTWNLPSRHGYGYPLARQYTNLDDVVRAFPFEQMGPHPQDLEEIQSS
eukprot:TRINITY_DN5668_c0_g1_i6.p1 TRINITY_DN5668_c0_g1~~TRINITY_DN5668_c0_g1_i6.p1  ORF type:complete len:547 (-),score=118.89 TRINITY_DN5668_c0_g1_i6:66-1706(-)